MSMKYRRGWCMSCSQFVRGEKKAVNHILHLILSIFTSGLWLFVWLLVVLSAGAKSHLCPTCGEELSDYRPKML
jgi:hypothetical protein